MTLLITGGAGFIGTNLTDYFLRKGAHVVVFDNLSRRGSMSNLDWLRARHPRRWEMIEGDVRHAEAVEQAVQDADADAVFHLAAQVAVTTSVADPRADFEVNALGAFNVLEAVRRSGRLVPLVFTSTNKVYGGLDDVAVAENGSRYEFRDTRDGIDERRPLDFHSPYGCSKGAADQYVRDYARIYRLPTVVFRMSCIYGPRQFGNEDQGWVAHFIISALLGAPLRIYGDGKQIRDVLFVLDLARAFELALQRIDRVAGECFNIGGGPANTLSLLELIGLIEQRLQRKLPRSFGKWRPGDQRVYVSDIGKARRLLGWQPQITAPGGVEMLLDWVQANKELFYEPMQHKLEVSQYRHSRQGRGRQHPLGVVRPERGHPAPQRVHS